MGIAEATNGHPLGLILDIPKNGDGSITIPPDLVKRLGDFFRKDNGEIGIGGITEITYKGTIPKEVIGFINDLEYNSHYYKLRKGDAFFPRSKGIGYRLDFGIKDSLVKSFVFGFDNEHDFNEFLWKIGVRK